MKTNPSKIQTSAIFIVITLLFALERCRITALPFLNGKFIYWLLVIIVGGIYFLLKSNAKKYSINKFDIYILILFSLGLYNFNYISNATLFNVNTWYFAGYLFLYFILRQILIEKEAIYRAINYIYYFLVFGAILNGIIAISQGRDLLTSENEHFKSTGLFYSPNHLALFLALGFISTFHLIKKCNNLYFKALLYISQIILMYALYISQCRGAYLALGAVFVFYIITLAKKKQSCLQLESDIVFLYFFIRFIFNS